MDDSRWVYSTYQWAVVRQRVRDRDRWRCKRCGKPGRLEVHHKRKLRDGGAPYDVANLETLCRACHFNEHRKLGEDPALRDWRKLVTG